jgi:hypothetical protein
MKQITGKTIKKISRRKETQQRGSEEQERIGRLFFIVTEEGEAGMDRKREGSLRRRMRGQVGEQTKQQEMRRRRKG